MIVKKSMIVLALILLVFSGCGEKIKYIYIKTPCPKLQTYEVNTTPQKHFKINYTVKEINE
jgi:TRAP-type mannitol/chloroaromatic compound transport system permease small subunit